MARSAGVPAGVGGVVAAGAGSGSAAALAVAPAGRVQVVPKGRPLAEHPFVRHPFTAHLPPCGRQSERRAPEDVENTWISPPRGTTCSVEPFSGTWRPFTRTTMSCLPSASEVEP